MKEQPTLLKKKSPESSEKLSGVFHNIVTTSLSIPAESQDAALS